MFVGNFSPRARRSIVDSTARINIWHGSVRSGKTFTSLVRWSEFVYNAPGGARLALIGKTREALINNCVSQLQDLYPSFTKLVKGDNRFVLFGKEIRLIGANDAKAEGKIRGSTLYGAYCDEVSLYPQDFFNMLLSRLSVDGAKLLATTNPDSPYHWLKTDYIDREDELNLRSFHFTMNDNLTLSPDYVKALKAEYSGLYYQRFIEGLWVMAQGVIYDMFDPERHTGDYIDKKFSNYGLAIDYGTQNPFAMGLFGWNDRPPVYLLKEYYYDGRNSMKQKTDEDYVNDVKEFIGDKPIRCCFVDPSASSFITLMNRRNYTVSHTDNSVEDGIRWVSTILNTDKLLIDKRCQHTIREFSSYVWDPRAQKRGEDKPLKENDHCMDFLRYFLFNAFPPAPKYKKPIAFNLGNPNK